MKIKQMEFLKIALAAGLVIFADSPQSSAQDTPPAMPAEELPAGIAGGVS